MLVSAHTSTKRNLKFNPKIKKRDNLTAQSASIKDRSNLFCCVHNKSGCRERRKTTDDKSNQFPVNI